MKQIIYDSQTGNTELLATTIHQIYPDSIISHVNQAEEIVGDILYLGSWCDKGNMTSTMQKLAQNLHHKKIFIFGTCGFGKDKNYFDMIAKRMTSSIPSDNEIIGTFVCQGKIDSKFQKKYEDMLESETTRRQAKMMLDNFKQAESHPNKNDLKALENELRGSLKF